MVLARLLLFALTLVVGPALAAQPVPGCDTAARGVWSPDASAWEHHQEAVRTLPNRLDPESVPCPDRVSGVDPIGALRGGVEGMAEVRQAWDREAGAWADTDRILRTVDADGQVSERVRQVPVGAGWQNTEQTLFATDGADQIQTEARWTADAWLPTRRASYLYRDDQRSLGERRESWDASAAMWRIDTQRTIGYDARDRLVRVLNEALDPASLQTVPVDQTRTTYSADALARDAVYQRWQAPGLWVNISRTVDVLDGAGARLSSTTDLQTAGAWVPSVRTLFVLDGAVDTVRTQTWSVAASAWEDTYRTLRSGSEGGALSLETNQAWVDGAWVNVSRLETEADASRRLLGFTSSLWQAGAWVYQRRQTRGYAGDELAAEVVERWDTGASTWRAVTDAAYEVSASGLPLRTVLRAFQDDGATLRSGSDTGWLYDPSDRATSRTTTVWDTDARDWVNGTRALFAYGLPPVARDAHPAGRLVVSVRPNPMAGAGTVRVDASGAVRADVFDLLGRRVAVLAEGSPGPQVLRLPPLAPGTYVVRVARGDDAVTQTITVVR